MLQGTAEPAELSDHELVDAPVGRQQSLVQFEAAGQLAGGLIDEDLLAVGSCQRVKLRLILQQQPAAGSV